MGPKVGFTLRLYRKTYFRTYFWGISWIPPKPTFELLLGYFFFQGCLVRRPRMSGRRMSGTTRRFPRHFWNCDFPKETKEKTARTWAPRLGLEVPDVLLPDIRDHPLWVLWHTRAVANSLLKLAKSWQKNARPQLTVIDSRPDEPPPSLPLPPLPQKFFMRSHSQEMGHLELTRA